MTILEDQLDTQGGLRQILKWYIFKTYNSVLLKYKNNYLLSFKKNNYLLIDKL